MLRSEGGREGEDKESPDSTRARAKNVETRRAPYIIPFMPVPQRKY